MLKQGIVIAGGLAMLWLLSAWEFGAVGSWVLFLIGAVLLVWACAFAYSNWRWAEEGRRQERNHKRLARKVIEQTNKERYLKECA